MSLRDGAVAARHPLRVRAVRQQWRALPGRDVQQKEAARLVTVQQVRAALVELLRGAWVTCQCGVARRGLAQGKRE